MTDAVPAPLTSQQEITETWLGEVLRHKLGEEVQVMAFSGKSPVSRDGFLSEMCFLEVTYSTQAEEEQKAFLVAKFLPENPEVREFMKGANLGQREVKFYSYSASEEFKTFCRKGGLPLPVPEVYWVGLTDDAVTIVLHNLGMDGYKVSVPAEGNNLEQVKSIVRSIAIIHGAGIASMRQHGGQHPVDIPFDSSILIEALQDGMNLQSKMFADTPWARIVASLQLRVKDLATIAKKHPFHQTLIHGDLWAGNVMFSEDNSTASIIDWQFALIGNPTCDIISLLLMSGQPFVYRNHLDEVLCCYWQSFKGAMKSNNMPMTVTYQQLKDNVEKLWMYGYMFVTASLPDLLQHNKITEKRVQAIFNFLKYRGAFKTFLHS